MLRIKKVEHNRDGLVDKIGMVSLKMRMVSEELRLRVAFASLNIHTNSGSKREKENLSIRYSLEQL